MAAEGHTTNWPNLAIDSYIRSTVPNAGIPCVWDDTHNKMPSGTGEAAEHAQ